MAVWGLTGGMGSGKSAVSRIFAQRGFDIIDADLMTRKLHHDPSICAELAMQFGDDVLDHSSDHVCVLRSRLAQTVFGSADALAALNRIMQPALYHALQSALEQCSGNTLLDAALLFEAGWDKLVSGCIVVVCPIEIRIERILARDGLPEAQIRSRIAAQMDDADRIRRAKFIIYNTVGFSGLAQQVDNICAQIG